MLSVVGAKHFKNIGPSRNNNFEKHFANAFRIHAFFGSYICICILALKMADVYTGKVVTSEWCPYWAFDVAKSA